MRNQQVSQSANQQTIETIERRPITNRGLPAHQTPNLAGIQSSKHPFIVRWTLLGGLLLAAYGASFAPWVDRPAAALVLTAPDLAEFVKFLPEVRDGSLRVHRLLFLLPLFVATLGLALTANARRLAYPRWVRWPVLVIAVPLSLTLLPPVWSPAVLLSAEFRLQTVACLLCLGLVATSGWLKRIATRPLLILLILAALVAPTLALWQFFVVRKAIARAYASPIVPGWGTWLTMAGCALLIISSALLIATED